ncbi:helix-turn-helix domain-containing protein, partial [Mycobacterium nebraskense]
MPSSGENFPAARDEGIQVLRRAAAALDEIAAEPGRLRLVDLGERLGLAKSTARRLLVGLVEVGLASVDSQGRFSLGDRLLGYGNSDGAHIAAIFRPTIERVARATEGETVDLSVLRGQRMWFVDQIESSHRLRAVSAVGVRFPLESTANGKAALAALEDAEAEAAISRLGSKAADRL